MIDTFITHLQVFGIGFTFGIAGPCFLVCTPILITYIVGRGDRWGVAVIDIGLFLFGRLFAYCLLGAIAGFGGYYLRRLAESGFVTYFNLASGLLSIALGVLIFFHKETPLCAHKRAHNNIYDFGSVLALGFLVGISPCVPLTALLLEIALISRTPLDGAAYAFSFGFGTFLSGAIIIGVLAGILKGSAGRLIRSKGANLIFKTICAGLLIIFGLKIMGENLRF